MKSRTVWDEESNRTLAQDLVIWYDEEKRLLPWRENTDPYRVWVSEIMLQQTQVVTVIPYFLRFLDWFPTIKDLAEAPEARILKAWEGLGYYSRVRNMQIAAQQIMTEFNGEMSSDLTDILTLKGIGPYTGGAIASISFNRVEPAIDGNVMRVYSRLYCLSDDIAKPKSRKVFDAKVRATMSSERPGDFNQALMDLGATVCTPKAPKCEECPLQKYCESYQKGTMLDYPVKSKKQKAVPKYYLALAMENKQHEYYFKQRPDEGLLRKMWTFPLVEVTKKEYETYLKNWRHYQEQLISPELLVAESSEDDLLEKLTEIEQQIIWQTQPLGEVTHLFTHLKWHLLICYGRLKPDFKQELASDERFLPIEEHQSLSFPKAQQKMIQIMNEKSD
ncbi:A/G-specific adenine glycosylase [Vagococcus silagei]|uniref:Adenine DNA glycosylase n=1 Tax=Vagococcus silagei TaxID=2508885 RepID=A0A4S3B5I0_9ENTE|nr:A/G-specific adenine glycosylase [Vagococcus silagei]THB62132.1 A/G-specific adenine glycosylase [Vagococcus silagei]